MQILILTAKRKELLENFWSEYCQKNKINLTILRLFNTFGLYQQPNRQGSLVANIFSNHLNDILIEINDMNAERDFVFSKDIRKIVDCVISENIYGLHDIASSKMISISDLLKKIKKVINKPLRFEDKGNTEKIICPVGSSFLYDKIESTDFDEALSQTYNFYLGKK
jgi:nucleoside-diphosphate-sugar epimerase